MSYVDAGYAIALSTVFVYAISLLVRRRRWDRALAVKESTPDEGAAAADRS
ncbi:MAG TPA: hypothetical protein VG346_15595 [Acidimicrobiales bacterium]|nr:hypothetical protein [Acidimicrobiales bacterium]